MERRLGRGLGSLLGQTPEPGSPQAESPSNAESTRPAGGSTQEPQVPAADVAAHYLDVSLIRRNPDQPRKTFDSTALEELRQSIQRHGVIQPICVRRTKAGYEIVSGERRWRAARSAGLAQIPATIKEDLDDGASLELAIVENVQREDLDALEKARGYQALMDRVGLSTEEVAERVGLSRSSIINHLRLLDLPAEVHEALKSGMVSMGHARALLSFKDEKSILNALGQVVRKGLSVRDIEKLGREATTARKQAASGEKGSAVGEASSAAPWIGEIEGQLREKLGVKVTLRNGKKYRGSITLDYSNRDELERIVGMIAPKDTL